MNLLPYVLAAVLVAAVAAGAVITTRADRSAAAAVEADLPEAPTWTKATLLAPSVRLDGVPAESLEEQTIEIPVVLAPVDPPPDPTASTDVFAAVDARPGSGRHRSGTWRPLVRPGERYPRHHRRGVSV